MPVLFNRNHRRPQSRSTPSEYQTNGQLQPVRTKCQSTIKIIKLVSAILVPLMIGAFTVVTTLQESKNAQMQRDAELAKMEHQAQLQREAEKRQREADAVKIKEQQERDDMNAKEIRIQSVYDTFMRDMSSIVLKDNLNLTIPEILFARAKTLLTLEQMDAKRKWYLIKFLYDSQLLYTRSLSMRYVDLTGVDLSNVRFGGDSKLTRRTDLYGIRFIQLQLRNASFENVGLNLADFDSSDLSNSNFIGVSMMGANFQGTILENSKFSLSSLQNSSFKNSKSKRSSWSSRLAPDMLQLNHVDYSNSDLSEATFQSMRITLNVKFDNANFERIQFFNMKFSTGAIFKNFNMKMSKFVNVQLLEGKFIQCDMFGAIFEKSHFKKVVFEYVDLRHSQFNDISDFGIIQFNKVNLIGSNINVAIEQIIRISDSLLPNGTFKTSFMQFGMNLIRNGDAEQGQCFHSLNQSFTASAPQGWSTSGNVMQVYYNNTDWRMDSPNYNSDWYSCFFFGGYQNFNQSKINENTIQQEINVERLAVLINSRQIKFQANAYLGGFEDEQSSTSMKIGFKNTRNITESAIVGPVTNVDRDNKTAMLFRSYNGTVPNDTISIGIELLFHRQKSHRGLRFGMADNLKFVIQRK